MTSLAQTRPKWWAIAAFGTTLLGAVVLTNKAATFLPPDITEDLVRPEMGLPEPEEGPLSALALPHGTFFFWGYDHAVRRARDRAPAPAWTEEQRRLLDDEGFDVDGERARCAAYGFGLANGTVARRRLFLGGLIADDSLEVLAAVGTEAWNVFHTVSFIESNTTQNLSPRRWRYLTADLRPSRKTLALQRLFGPRTKVSVDYYVTSRKNSSDPMIQERIQKEGILRRWELNGMGPDDVAVIVDADETFTRDFLRVLQACDVPELRPGPDCRAPKVIASTLILESTPECVTRVRRGHHPDAVRGECVERIGDPAAHPPPLRGWLEPSALSGERWVNMTKRIRASHGKRAQGYGNNERRKPDYSVYDALHGAGRSPLWSGSDFRDAVGGRQYSKQRWGYTAYHFHNFFGNLSEIHWKYSTYGHYDRDAIRKPLWKLQLDLASAVLCTHPLYHADNFATLPDGEPRPTYSFDNRSMESFESLPNDHAKPIYYLNKEVRRKRHLAWQQIVQEEEIAYKRGGILSVAK